MQLLLPGADGKPGPSLRPAFAAAAIREAEHWWLGDLSEFRAIVSDAISPAYGGDWRVEPRRDADRAAATCTEAPARARAAETPRGRAAETSRPRTREGAGAGGSGGAAPPQ